MPKMIPETGTFSDFKRCVLSNVELDRCNAGHRFVAFESGYAEAVTFLCPTCSRRFKAWRDANGRLVHRALLTARWTVELEQDLQAMYGIEPEN